jgi:hypothetical protein
VYKYETIKFLQKYSQHEIIEIGTGLGEVASHFQNSIGLDVDKKVLRAARFLHPKLKVAIHNFEDDTFLEWIATSYQDKKIIIVALNVLQKSQIRKFIELLEKLNKLNILEFAIIDILKSELVETNRYHWIVDNSNLDGLVEFRLIITKDNYRDLAILFGD